MSDIIELGSDGTFEMPMPPVPLKGSSGVSAGNVEASAEGKNENEAYLEDASANALKGVASIPQGGYKIYDEHDARALSVVVRFQTEEERVKSCRVSSTSVEVTTTDGTVMTVPLVNAVKANTATCSTADSVVVVRIQKAT
jgi:hypothetical protein